MTGIYFSGTGNTKYCVSHFLETLGTENKLYSIEDSEAVKAIYESRNIVFAYPIYYSNLPKIVRDFIVNNGSLWSGKNIFILTTMGAFSGDGAGVSARLFKKFGAKITGGVHIKMPDCIGDVGALKKPPEGNREIIKAATEKAERAAKAYLDGKPPKDGLNIFNHIAGLFGQRLWFIGQTKDYKQDPKIDSEKCVGCGTCEKLCPMSNIHVENGKAVAGNKCTMCYRCMSNCPQQAITIIGKKVLVQYKFDDYDPRKGA